MHKTLFTLALGGFLFSGYMSGVKFFSGNCAFKEGCPYFLGFPACYYGFAMFTLILIFSGLLLFRKMEAVKALTVLMMVSGLGILFAGYYTVGEMSVLFNEGLSAYLLGLPTCAYGLIFYVAIGTVAWRAKILARMNTMVSVDSAARV